MISRFLLVYLAIISAIIGPTTTYALDAGEIYKFEVCAKTKPRFDDQEIINLITIGKFPGPARRIGEFVRGVEIFNGRGTSNFECPGTLMKPPHPIVSALSAVTTDTAKLIANDIENQKNLIANGHACAQQWVKASQGSASTTVTPSMFNGKSGDGPSPKECAAFVNAFVPELQRRFKRMRQYLALSKRPIVAGKPLEHEKPFSTFLTEKFVGSVWKSNGRLPGLTPDEIKELPELISQMNGDPMAMYYQVLSTSPILLFFTDEPTPASIENAFAKLEAQASFDLKSFEKNPPQEIMLYTPYVLKAIEGLPIAQRADACQAVKAIYENLVEQYIDLPRQTNMLGLVFSVLPIGKAGVMTKEFFTIFMKRAGVAGLFTQGLAARTNLEIYAKGVTMCSSIAMEKNVNPSIDGLCRVEHVNNQYLEAQSNMITGAVMGSLIFGVGRTVGRFTGAARTATGP